MLTAGHALGPKSVPDVEPVTEMPDSRETILRHMNEGYSFVSGLKVKEFSQV